MSSCGSEVEGNNAEVFALPLSQQNNKKYQTQKTQTKKKKNQKKKKLKNIKI